MPKFAIYNIPLMVSVSVALCYGTVVATQDRSLALLDEDFAVFDERQVAVGQLLFYDPLLSGNRNISCATCHHPRNATSDGLSLGIGEGGSGLGPDRRIVAGNVPEELIPRNSPALFNLGHADIAVMFHDGRIEIDPDRPSGFRTPLAEDMASGFASLLSAQTMFPVLSPDEMAGQVQENDVALAVRQGRLTGPDGAWSIIAQRVDDIDAYREMFAAFDPVVATGGPVEFTDISDAIAAFIAVEWRADQTPYDLFLRGGPALPADAQRGMEAFFGEAGCSGCHSGPLLSDQAFHAMADPQLGPGKAASFEDHQRDVGRMLVTGAQSDAYAFRTPMLRNVVLTGPWGHAGGYSDLAAYLAHHANPVEGLAHYSPDVRLIELEDAEPIWAVMDDSAERAAIVAAYGGNAVMLGPEEIADLLAFMEALTDVKSLERGLGVPDTVPSGLPVDR